MCDLLVHDSSVVFLQFLWSGGRVVQADREVGDFPFNESGVAFT